MPINWDEFNDGLDEDIQNAADATDDKLASKLSSLTRMTDEEVKELFPVPSDVKKLTELMAIVHSSTDRNTKINNIVTNAEKFGGVMMTLIGKFV